MTHMDTHIHIHHISITILLSSFLLTPTSIFLAGRLTQTLLVNTVNTCPELHHCQLSDIIVCSQKRQKTSSNTILWGLVVRSGSVGHMRLTELLRIATLQEFYKADRFFTSCDVCIGHTPDFWQRLM
jgi:hypothetical protein